MPPELLAPAGDASCLRAAIENGADAVYFGLADGFNARARAANFALADLPGVMETLHRRGVKGYVTLNTLAFTDELPRLQLVVRELTRAGVDAMLVQDLGLVRLIRALSPDLSIHASTQMTLTSGECLAVAKELGIDRVVLARELSIAEIRKIRSQTDVPLEVFVHGALCVAYSGQCLTSESLGGRSANRGQCAQACRLPYELVCDGKDVDLGDVKYLLSPQDLAAYALTPELIAAGVAAFKIEGRLKTPEYVANITRHYRRAIDAAMAGKPVDITKDDVREMELSFSRGFSPGWLQGDDHKMLVPGLSSAKRGVHLGEIVRVRHNRVEVRLTAPIKRGDGVVFEGDRAADAEQRQCPGRWSADPHLGDDSQRPGHFLRRPAQPPEQGGRVFGVFRRGAALEQAVSSGVVELEFQRGAIEFQSLAPGQAVWKTDDPELTARLRKTFAGPDALRCVAVNARVRAVVGEPLRIELTTELGGSSEWISAFPLAAATKHPATAEFLREQLGRLGHTVYALRECHSEIAGGPLVPLSVLGQARKALVSELDRLSGMIPSRRIAEGDVLAELRGAIPGERRGVSPPCLDDDQRHGGLTPRRSPGLHVLCRTLEQLGVVLQQPVDGVYVDFQDIREYRHAVAAARDASVPIFLAPPRIQKPAEMGIFRALVKHRPDGLLVRNLAGMRFCRDRGVPFVADFSLNATNELTVQYLIEQGAQRVTASYDLNRDQLLDLVRVVPAEWLEVVIHQHMPMFHMEHCVFCAVLSPGTNKTNCGRPCDRHAVHLRDRVGMEHRLTADVGCRNTLFNAVPQSAAEVTPDLLAAGVRSFRVELLDETPDEIRRTLGLYRELLAGQVRGEAVWRALRASNRVGVTRGTLEERRNPLTVL
jgi:putative protease